MTESIELAQYGGQGQLDTTRKGNWMRTQSGKRFWPLDPKAEEVFLDDIAHSLSLQCRFNGHTNQFYSVAQHCLMVSFACDPADAMWGLLHDAAEAYVTDMPRPLKQSPELEGYRDIERSVELAVCQRFGLAPDMPESVKRADEILLATEARDLMGNPSDWHFPYPPLADPILCMSPSVAYQRFMARFAFLHNLSRPKPVAREVVVYDDEGKPLPAEK